MITQVVEELKKTEHGFKHIMQAGDDIMRDATNYLKVAEELLTDESYQGRMLGTYLLGLLSPTDDKALQLLKTTVANDDNWRVQEMLAKAIDHYCKVMGYEKALPELKKWLKNKHPNLNRAVIEGLRIWTSRPYFKQHPEVAIAMIAQHKANKSDYVKKSVGNALRDISRKHADLVRDEIATWNLSNKEIAYTCKIANLK